MNHDEPLRERLRAWRSDLKVPRNFHADVWARIRAQEEERAATGWAAFGYWLFPSPVTWQLATAVAVLMLALGAGLGNLTANAANERSRSELAQRYAQSIDPYLQLAQHAR